MRRLIGIALVLLIIILLLTPIGYFILQQEKYGNIFTKGKDILAFAIAALQLLIVVLIVAIVIWYLLFRKYHFLFKGFSNAPMLSTVEERPLELNTLAREMLVRQFKWMYRILMKYLALKHLATGTKGLDIDALLANPPQEEHYTDQSAYSLSEYNPGQFLPYNQIVALAAELKKVIYAFQDHKDLLLSMIGESAPKEISPIIQLLDKIIPPRTIEIIGHLQWDRNVQTTTARLGISFEVVGPGNLQNLMPRTIWWQSSDKDGGEIFQVADGYIGLLVPAMHWLMLIFVEYQIALSVPVLNHIFHRWEKKRLAQLHYLMGALYANCYEHYPAYESFFWQLAVEHFQQATEMAPDWSAPYLYIANIYSYYMQKQKQKVEKKRLFNLARERYEEGKKHTRYTGTMLDRNKLLLAWTLTEVSFYNVSHFEDEKTKEELLGTLQTLRNENFILSQADGPYLYNLALLYMLLRENHFNERILELDTKNIEEYARRLLAYSLARSPEFDDIAKEDVSFRILKIAELEQKLNARRKGMATLKGASFKTEIEELLK